MEMAMEEAVTRSLWGTWEELVLGGAVLRHGAGSAWDAVADEVRARSASPDRLLFTPKECQDKYRNIMEQYSGCDEWFEELRNRRVAELRRELEKSEDSIGSLRSKLETLTSERDSDSNLACNTSHTETSPSPDHAGINDAAGINSSEELSKGGSSTGSITENPGRDCSPECENAASVSPQECKLEIQSPDDLMAKAGCGCSWSGFGKSKGKRGKRKRKGYRVKEEDSVGDSDRLSSAAAVLMDRDGSQEGHNQETKLPAEDSSSGSMRGEDDSHLDLARILDSVMKRKDVSVFRQRLDSQKKARYKKIIRRHVDFQNISSRIGNGSISSAKELLRELLLLSNNALVFYPKNSAEHKSALILRDLSNKFLQSHAGPNQARSSENGVSVLDDAAKPKSTKVEKVPSTEPSKKNVSKAAATGRKRGIGRPVKGTPRGGKKQQESPNKGRKRARR